MYALRGEKENEMAKSVLSPKATKIVDKVIKLLSIPENSKFYNQETFVDSLNGESVSDRNDKVDPVKVKECGTECCIAGWVVYANSPKDYEDIALRLDGREILQKAEKLMGNADTANLFSGAGSGWPQPYGGMFGNARTRFQKAKAAVARLKHFRATGK
jgi:hypothetical protein